ETLYQKGRFPAWTYDVDDDTYYGFPSIDGAGVKIGRHSGGHPVNSTDSLDAFGTYPEDMGDVARLSRSEEHTSELQSRFELVCRLLLEKQTDQPLQPRRHGRAAAAA